VGLKAIRRFPLSHSCRLSNRFFTRFSLVSLRLPETPGTTCHFNSKIRTELLKWGHGLQIYPPSLMMLRGKRGPNTFSLFRFESWAKVWSQRVLVPLFMCMHAGASPSVRPVTTNGIYKCQSDLMSHTFEHRVDMYMLLPFGS
jgi:hypothetical protein